MSEILLPDLRVTVMFQETQLDLKYFKDQFCKAFMRMEELSPGLLDLRFNELWREMVNKKTTFATIALHPD